MELTWNAEVVRNDSIMALFDLSAHYQLDSDIPQPYSLGERYVLNGRLKEEELRRPLDDLRSKRSLHKRGQSPVVWIARFDGCCVIIPFFVLTFHNLIHHSYILKAIAMHQMRASIISQNS